MVKNADFLDVALAKPSLEAYDDLLNAYYSGDRLLIADNQGEIQARRQARTGGTIDGVESWIPGKDSVIALDVAKSLASDEPRAKKLVDDSSPDTLHVALDLPERLSTVEGRYFAKNVGLYALSVTAVIARETGAKIKLYHNDGNRSRLIFDEPRIDDLYIGFEEIENGQKTINRSEISNEPSLKGLLDLTDSQMDVDNDGMIIVSDFQDGYREQDFEWSKHLSDRHAAFGDRLRAIRLQTNSHFRPSIAHTRLPAHLIGQIESDYNSTAQEKQARISELLGNWALTIGLSEGLDEQQRRPSVAISDYIVGGNF